jgi:hypothetical protein
MNGPRGQVAERGEDETPFVIAGMGKNEPRRVHAPAAEGEKIEIQRPGTPADAAAAAQPPLDGGHSRQKLPRPEARAYLRHAVQEPSLARATHRFGFIQGRHPDDAHAGHGVQRGQRPLDERQPPAPVGAEPDEGGGSGCWRLHLSTEDYTARGRFRRIDGKRIPLRRKNIQFSLTKNFILVYSLGHCDGKTLFLVIPASASDRDQVRLLAWDS